MHVKFGGDLGLDPLQELQELLMAVAAVHRGDDLSSGQIEGRE